MKAAGPFICIAFFIQLHFVSSEGRSYDCRVLFLVLKICLTNFIVEMELSGGGGSGQGGGGADPQVKMKGVYTVTLFQVSNSYLVL